MTGPRRARSRAKTTTVDVKMRLKYPIRMQEERQRRKWSQRRLAKEIGCSQSMVHLLETAKVPGADTPLALRLCRKFDLRLEDLFEVPWGSSAAERSTGPRTGCEPEEAESA